MQGRAGDGKNILRLSKTIQGKFDLKNVVINIVAGLGLLSFISMFCDFILLNYVNERFLVRQKKNTKSKSKEKRTLPGKKISRETIVSLIFTPTKGEAEEVRGDLWQISVWGRSQSIFSGSTRLPQWLIIWNRVADFRQHGIQLNRSDCLLSINSTPGGKFQLVDKYGSFSVFSPGSWRNPAVCCICKIGTRRPWSAWEMISEPVLDKRLFYKCWCNQKIMSWHFNQAH